MGTGTTLAYALEEAADGPIEGVVIGHWGGSWSPPDCALYENKRDAMVPLSMRGRVLTWEEARPLLTYEWDDGYGSADLHAVYAWSKDRVVFIEEYDGSTWVAWLPRNPTDCIPHLGGF